MNRKRTFTFTVATVISTLVLSTFMTGLMNISDWIRAWMVGWAIGTPIVFFVAPISKRVGQYFSDDPRDK
jgi:hypothetical protein